MIKDGIKYIGIILGCDFACSPNLNVIEVTSELISVEVNMITACWMT